MYTQLVLSLIRTNQPGLFIDNISVTNINEIHLFRQQISYG